MQITVEWNYCYVKQEEAQEKTVMEKPEIIKSNKRK